jgi:transmembrane sensor
MKQPDESVIMRFLTGDCTDSELEELRNWISSSEENAAELFRLEESYRRMYGLTMSGRETEKALLRVHADIDRNTLRKTAIFKIMRYAASLLVVALISTGIWYWGSHTNGSAAAEYIIAKASMHAPREITLCDSSHVWLNAGSSLKYPKTFAGDERRVELQGEGYFEIAKNKAKPFVVSGGMVEVKVLGTVFNFNVNSDRKIAEVSLIKGSVEVAEHLGSGRVMLLPGQKARVDCETGRMLVQDADVRLDAVWHNSLIPFYNANVRQIANTLEQLYDVDIEIDPNIDNMRTYSGQITHKQDIDSVLKLLENTLPIAVCRKEGKIYIKTDE